MVRVFIDGEAGTTGLQIRDRLSRRGDVKLVSVDPARRKDPDTRRAAFAAADVAILCLPDAAAREAVAIAGDIPVRIIDASSAHRTAEEWTYGLPELGAAQARAISEAQLVANPGCYPTGAIALLAPLVRAGLIDPDERLTINAVSGYSGGGKELIGEFDAGTAPDFFAYGLGQSHKHLPEIVAHAGLKRAPVFAPSVGNFAQGMIVQVPLHLEGRSREAIRKVWDEHYAGTGVEIVEPQARVIPTALNDTNRMQLSVHGNHQLAVLVAVLDNLGKGASGAAVQNLDLMIGA